MMMNKEGEEKKEEEQECVRYCECAGGILAWSGLSLL